MSTSRDVVEEPDTVRSLIRPAAAEFLGCFFFLFIAVGSAMNTVNFITPVSISPRCYLGSVESNTPSATADVKQGATQISIALAFGFTIFVLAFTIGHISGGHLNNAVTFAMVITRRISPLRGVMYFIAQVDGP